MGLQGTGSSYVKDYQILIRSLHHALELARLQNYESNKLLIPVNIQFLGDVSTANDQTLCFIG